MAIVSDQIWPYCQPKAGSQAEIDRTILLQQLTFSISERAPFLAGHFPGNPVVPSVVFLNWLLEGVVTVYLEHHMLDLSHVKSHQSALPGQQILVSLISMNVVASAFRPAGGGGVQWQVELWGC